MSVFDCVSKYALCHGLIHSYSQVREKTGCSSYIQFPIWDITK